MKNKTYRRNLKYIPNICDNGTVYWILYKGHKMIRIAGTNETVIADRRRINKFEHWTRIQFRYYTLSI